MHLGAIESPHPLTIEGCVCFARKAAKLVSVDCHWSLPLLDRIVVGFGGRTRPEMQSNGRRVPTTAVGEGAGKEEMRARHE